MNLLIIANILSLISSCILAYSTFYNKKEKMFSYQLIDSFCSTVSNLLIMSLSACIMNAFSIIRNYMNAKGLKNKTISILVVIFQLLVGLLINNNGIIGLIAVSASIEYSIISFINKDTQIIRISLFLNILLWFIHDFCVGLYTSAVIKLLVLLVIFINYLRFRKKGE